MFAITGATGNTGGVVAEKLLAGGQKVRVIGRNASRLAPYVQKGAQPFTADVTDVEGLARAFEGAEGVYALIPPNIASNDVFAYQDAVAKALASAINKASVPRAVTLSSIGADKAEKTGPVVGLHNLEERLNAIPGLSVIHLRAGYFMENVLPQLDVIRNFGIVGGPLRPDLDLPMIATQDIGAVAAELLKSGFTGQRTRELLGQRDVNYKEVASVIGKAIGKPELNYVQLPPQQFKSALSQMGMSPNMADLLLEMTESLNNGYMRALESRTAENSTPTSIEAFAAEEFAPRFRAKAATA
jgi:uncharacterized protein YbjT (DUF2867 family)